MTPGKQFSLIATRLQFLSRFSLSSSHLVHVFLDVFCSHAVSRIPRSRFCSRFLLISSAHILFVHVFSGGGCDGWAAAAVGSLLSGSTRSHRVPAQNVSEGMGASFLDKMIVPRCEHATILVNTPLSWSISTISGPSTVHFCLIFRLILSHFPAGCIGACRGGGTVVRGAYNGGDFYPRDTVRLHFSSFIPLHAVAFRRILAATLCDFSIERFCVKPTGRNWGRTARSRHGPYAQSPLSLTSSGLLSSFFFHVLRAASRLRRVICWSRCSQTCGWAPPTRPVSCTSVRGLVGCN